MQEIQKINEISELISYIKESSQKNEQEIIYIQTTYPMDQPMNKFIYDKLQFLQDVLLITMSALRCVNDLQDQKKQLQKSNSTLKQQLNDLCQANNKLNLHIYDLVDKIKLHEQQLDEYSRRQQHLQLQTSMIKKQLQQTKSKLQENQEKLLSKIQGQIEKQNCNIGLDKPQLNSKMNIISNLQLSTLALESKNKNMQESKGNNQGINFNEDIKNIKKQLNELNETKNILRKKYTLDQYSLNNRQSQKENHINSLSYLSSTIPRQLIKNKLANQTLRSIKHSSLCFHKKQSNMSIILCPTKLNLQISSLNFQHTKSMVQEQSDYINGKILDSQEYATSQRLQSSQCLESSQTRNPFRDECKTQQLKLTEITQKQQFFSPTSSVYDSFDKKKSLQQSDYFEAQSALSSQQQRRGTTTNPNKPIKKRQIHDISFIKKKSSRSNFNQQFANVIDFDGLNDRTEDCLCKNIRKKLWNIHQFLFNKIVRDRIQPRRSIKKERKHLQEVRISKIQEE